MKKRRWVRLSPLRRFMVDIQWLAGSFPGIPIRTAMDVGRLVQARRGIPDPPSWPALFAKAYGLVARDMPVLRRSYVKLPWPHLCEYSITVATFAIEREYEGEQAVFFLRIKDPESRPLGQITETIRHAKESPIEDNKDYVKLLDFARKPWPLRRFLLWCGANIRILHGPRLGTLGITTVGSLGAELVHPRGPVTAVLTYGPIGDDGSVDVTIIFDHRVTDGAVFARAMQRLEETLNGAILAELNAGERNLSASPGNSGMAA